MQFYISKNLWRSKFVCNILTNNRKKNLKVNYYNLLNLLKFFLNIIHTFFRVCYGKFPIQKLYVKVLSKMKRICVCIKVKNEPYAVLSYLIKREWESTAEQGITAVVAFEHTKQMFAIYLTNISSFIYFIFFLCVCYRVLHKSVSLHNVIRVEKKNSNWNYSLPFWSNWRNERGGWKGELREKLGMKEREKERVG